MEAELVPQKHGGALRKGGGRPKGAKDKYLSAIRDALLVERTGKDGDPELSGVIPALIKEAQEGDVRAIELCLAYGIGKPTQSVEISGTDGGAIVIAPALAALSDEELAERAKRIAGDDE